jgi:hypothetical protein
VDAAERLEQNLDVELAANDLYEQWRAGAKDRRGRRLHGVGAKPYVPPELPEGLINLSDPGLAGDAQAGHAAASGVERAG